MSVLDWFFIVFVAVLSLVAGTFLGHRKWKPVQTKDPLIGEKAKCGHCIHWRSRNGSLVYGMCPMIAFFHNGEFPWYKYHPACPAYERNPKTEEVQ